MTEENPVILRQWTVKSMPEAVSADAASYARRHQMSVAELVAESLKLRMGQPIPPRRQDLQEGLPVEALVALVTSPHVQKWLRSAAAREIGSMMGVEPRKSNPPNRINVAVTHKAIAEESPLPDDVCCWFGQPTALPKQEPTDE